MAGCKRFATLEDALSALAEHERLHTVRFVQWSSPKGFGTLNPSDFYQLATQVEESHATVDRPKVSFFKNTPYITLASRLYYCQFGQDQKKKRKEKKTMAAGLVQVLDPSLVSRIKELVEDRMVDVDAVKAEVKEFVRDNISSNRYRKTKEERQVLMASLRKTR
ncbi:hypothetical protein DPMN_068577 [Dreissena polymorpha]|uniref:Uncharacterized protein n=1 Tax=Dreissena polymorpha TaxID=45954 RepID=A0A9D3Z1V5_DREPO|nr:hypothetical protein DPMN_068577 [Dreissena polymorpha]